MAPWTDGTLYAAANFILEEGEQECGQLYAGWASTGEAGGETSSRMRTIVQGWHAANPEALRASAASLSAAQQEKLGRMATVA